MMTRGYRYILTMHMVMLLVFTLLRLVTMCVLHFSMDDAGVAASDYAAALFMGIRLDNIVASYVTVVAFLMLQVMLLAPSLRTAVMHILKWYYAVCSSLLTAHTFANIPFCKEFNHPIDLTALRWLDNGTEVFSMLLRDWRFLTFGILVIALIPLCVWMSVRINRRFAGTILRHTRRPNAAAFLAYAAFFVLSIRGFKTAGHPLNSTDAYITDNHYVNLCTQCPVLYFINSATRYQRLASVSFYTDEQLRRNAREFFGTTDMSAPWTHDVAPSDTARFAGSKPNIVLIFMESMSTHYMQSFGQKRQLTPFIDSLYQQSLHFSRCYSAGFRTGQGILGVLCSWPSFMNRNVTNEHRLAHFGGLPEELATMGYSTTCFVSHDPNFDGLYDFLTTNGIRRLYSMNDYPQDRSVGTWGVPDGYLYDYAVDAITRGDLGLQPGTDRDAPFFAMILSISNHAPYDLPTDFHGRHDSAEYNALQYADESLRRFFDKARRQPWYDNTIFVLVGDHGLVMEKQQECELPDMINHVPLMIYGNGIAPQEYQGMVSQNDIAAVILSMLGHGYRTNSLATDVLSHERPYAIYSDGSWIACRDRQHLFLFNYNDDIRKYYRVTGTRLQPVAPDRHLQTMERYCLTTYQLLLNQLKQF